MELVNSLAENYAAHFTSSLPAFIVNVHEQTVANHPQNHLQSSLTQGSFLTFLCNLLQPKNVLEIGTFTGFSALCMAHGMAKEGVLHTIELREEDAFRAQENFASSPYKNQVHLHIGNAKSILPNLNKKWDLVFIDADKVSYTDYFSLVFPNMAKNGLIIADNVLFHGQVLENSISGKNAKAIHQFNQYIAEYEDVEQVMLTIRDGLLLIRKK
jgi:predicted O-methyltransferase YrrM